MASASVEYSNTPYYGVTVAFGEQTFFQIIISYLIEADFINMLQNYADDYEREWLALVGV